MIYERSGKNLIWSIKNSVEVLDTPLKTKDFNATGSSTYDFLLLAPFYLIIKFKINLLILLKEPSKTNVLLTLQIAKETHFSL